MVIGKIVKPQGIRGELKVVPMTDEPSRFCLLKEVSICGNTYSVTNARVNGSDVYLLLDGVCDRNEAETFRNKLVEIPRENAVELSEGEFFIADLIGCKLVSVDVDTEENVGVIEKIESFGAADVFTVDVENGKISFAFVSALNPRLDIENKVLFVDAKRLKAVAVYEN